MKVGGFPPSDSLGRGFYRLYFRSGERDPLILVGMLEVLLIELAELFHTLDAQV